MTATWLLIGLALVLAPRPRATTSVPVRESGGPASVPLCLDLVAAALAAGRPVPDALDLATPVAPVGLAAPLRRVAALLRLGADAPTAWAQLADEPALIPVAAAACRSAESGARTALAFTRLADDLRASARASGRARAQRLGVLVAAPLGLCFLPGFVCLGVAPVVVGVVRTVLGG